ncbi:MAG: DNA/RNA non-specific endonuclease [Hyphomicrobiaceae bacterium]|nr:DNA/RNA non-specific endonuclease [Hyphomicrobiaceae bacterium]
MGVVVAVDFSAGFGGGSVQSYAPPSFQEEADNTPPPSPPPPPPAPVNYGTQGSVDQPAQDQHEPRQESNSGADNDNAHNDNDRDDDKGDESLSLADHAWGFVTGAFTTVVDEVVDTAVFAKDAAIYVYDSSLGAPFELYEDAAEFITGNETNVPRWLPDSDRADASTDTVIDTAVAVVTHPVATVQAVAEPVTSPLGEGHYGEALGVGLAMFLDPLGKLGKLGKLDDVAHAGRLIAANLDDIAEVASHADDLAALADDVAGLADDLAALTDDAAAAADDIAAAADDVADVAEDVVEVADDAAAAGDDVADVADDLADTHKGPFQPEGQRPAGMDDAIAAAKRTETASFTHPDRVGNVAGPNQATWYVDDEGRTVAVQATITHDASGLGKPKSEKKLQSRVGNRGEQTDNGGHIVAFRFVNNQSREGRAHNLFPQNAEFNNGAYRDLEIAWADIVENNPGYSVDVEWSLKYPEGSPRPDTISIVTTVRNEAGELVDQFPTQFENQASATFDAPNLQNTTLAAR